jgi:hypothetical protein
MQINWNKYPDVKAPEDINLLVVTKDETIRIMQRWNGFWTDLETPGLDDSDILYWSHLPNIPSKQSQEKADSYQDFYPKEETSNA